MNSSRALPRGGSPPDGEDFVLGIDFGGTKVALAVARRTGEILARDRLATAARRGAEQVVQRVIVAAGALISEGELLSGGRCVAVGAVSPGIVLPDRILLAPNVPGWGDLHLAELLAEGLGCLPVVVGTDTKAGALLGHPITAAELFQVAENDSRAARLVSNALDELAVHIANLAMAIDPARIAVGGGMMGSAEMILPALGRRLEQAVPFPPDLVPAYFVLDAPLRGAIALAADACAMHKQPVGR